MKQHPIHVCVRLHVHVHARTRTCTRTYTRVHVRVHVRVLARSLVRVRVRVDLRVKRECAHAWACARVRALARARTRVQAGAGKRAYAFVRRVAVSLHVCAYTNSPSCMFCPCSAWNCHQLPVISNSGCGAEEARENGDMDGDIRHMKSLMGKMGWGGKGRYQWAWHLAE